MATSCSTAKPFGLRLLFAVPRTLQAAPARFPVPVGLLCLRRPLPASDTPVRLSKRQFQQRIGCSLFTEIRQHHSVALEVAALL